MYATKKLYIERRNHEKYQTEGSLYPYSMQSQFRETKTKNNQKPKK